MVRLLFNWETGAILVDSKNGEPGRDVFLLYNEREPSASPRFDQIINILVDGRDANRAALLEQLRRHPVLDREGLAARLHDCIRNDFSPAREREPVTALRDPKSIPSVRSWMLSVLIWIDPSSPTSSELLLEHIDPRREPDHNVRFWTLAGIVQRELPYVRRAVARARKDPSGEISNLALIAGAPESEALHNQFREALYASDFQTVWNVLRVLRIFPVPALAQNVVDLLVRRGEEEPVAYDVLYALANPPMAFAARPMLLESPGLSRLAELVLNEARRSPREARTAFARLLSVFPPRAAAIALRAASREDDASLITQMLIDMAEVRDAASEQLISGYTSDTINIAEDDIGIKKDVETLSSVMMAREVKPPLAIGLFGEWGAGKSFFIQSIAAEVARISKEAREQNNVLFCSHVVQIHFNAWHYVDASLWASLMTKLLDELSSYLSPVPTSTAREARLNHELASVRQEMASAEIERRRAADQLAESTEALQKAIVEREQSELGLRDLQAADLMKLLESDKNLDKALKESLEAVGAPAALESISELTRVIEDSYSTGGRASALLTSIFRDGKTWYWVAGIAALLLIPPTIGWLVAKFVTPNVASTATFGTQLAVAVTSISVVINRALKSVKAGLDTLSNTKRKIDALLAAKRATRPDSEKELEEALAKAKANEKAAIERVSIASARAQTLEDRIAGMERNQSLGYFVSERSRSDDYRRHLGLISTVRKDFEELVTRLSAAQRDPMRPIERIVLYIDDVDRCPPDAVVDILQAVHLLLAYELFVVVVSVDPRWLMRSLEVKFDHLKSAASVGVELGGATPQDYLEKIFQIPFSVRPMDDLAFSKMMRRLLAPTQRAVEELPNIQPLDPGSQHRAEFRKANPNEEEKTAHREEIEAEPDLQILARGISISEEEAEASERLHMLLATPRSAKRFANVYRLLKASIPQHDLQSFEGSAGTPGNFQLPMLLLAALVGDSTSAAVLFPQFLSQARLNTDQWWISPNEDIKESVKITRLREHIQQIANADGFPNYPELVVDWLPRVARFSFLTARMFLDTRQVSNVEIKLGGA